MPVDALPGPTCQPDPCVYHPHCRASLHDAAVALGWSAHDAEVFAQTGQARIGSNQLLLQPLHRHAQGPWAVVVQRPRPAHVDEHAWLSALLIANSQAMLGEDASFAIDDSGDALLVQRLADVEDALLLSINLYGALLLAMSVLPDPSVTAGQPASLQGVPSC